MNYYPIDEALARRAKEMNSFYDYKEGSATAAYREAVDAAVQIAKRQKRQVAPMYHEKIDHLLDTYARKLAENTNRRNEIASRVPSILIAGGSNFPVRKKERQNRADDAAMEEWRQIQGLLDKIRSTGRGGISADDPEALAKLKIKLEGKEQLQEHMKAVNAYYRKNKTLDGCPGLAPEEIEKLKASMARDWRADPKPYESYALTNNNAVIRQTKARIEELSKKAEMEYEGWVFAGGEVKMDRQANRLQVFFHEKPDRDTCSAMRHGGFRWAPSVGAWQRQITDNAIRAAKNLDCLRPLSVEQPTQAPERAEPVLESPPDSGWRFYIIADLKTWADNAENRSPLEYFPSFEEAKTRFLELRDQSYNSEALDPGPDGRPPARLTLGLESADGLSAADILHVRQGRNFLVTDFTQMERLAKDPAVSEILRRVSREIGLDLVRPSGCPEVSFEEWDNPYFPAATAGSIAAGYYDLLHQLYPLPKDESSRAGSIAQIVRFLQKKGETGVSQMKLAVDSLMAGREIIEPVREQAEALKKELNQYCGFEKAPQQKRKAKLPER